MRHRPPDVSIPPLLEDRLRMDVRKELQWDIRNENGEILCRDWFEGGLLRAADGNILPLRGRDAKVFRAGRFVRGLVKGCGIAFEPLFSENSAETGDTAAVRSLGGEFRELECVAQPMIWDRLLLEDLKKKMKEAMTA